MAKNHKRKKKNKKEEKIVFPNYVFESGELEGQDVKSIIAKGIDGLILLSTNIGYDNAKEGRRFACTGSIIYELGHAIDKLIKDAQGDYFPLIVALNELTSQIGWYPNVVFGAARECGYQTVFEFLTSDDDEDWAYALKFIRMFIKEIYMADPLDVDLDFRCHYCKMNGGLDKD